MKKKPFDYKFSYGDPGMFLELYVPTTYEPEVRQFLEDGIRDIGIVQDHLKKHIEHIHDLLSDHTTLRNYTPSRVDELERVLEGFSIYHGDGAFWDSSEEVVMRDCVSVVRLMFTPPLEDWIQPKSGKKLSDEKLKEPLKKARFVARQFLRFWTHNKDKYLQHRGEGLPPEDLQLIEHLTKWLDDIALIVNGYVIHHLCCRLKELKKEERQIWVGSFRSLAVNRVVWMKEQKKKTKQGSPPNRK